MDSLVAYGSDDDCETERYGGHSSAVTSHSGSGRRRDDDVNYDDVNMDMSEDSGADSEPELPPAETHDSRTKHENRGSDDSRERSSKSRDFDRRDRRRERRSPRKDERHRSDRDKDRSERVRPHESSSRRERTEEKSEKVPSLLDVKPFAGESSSAHRSHDSRDAASPRFVDRRDRDRDTRDKERGRDKERHNRRSEEKREGGEPTHENPASLVQVQVAELARSSHRHSEHRSRSRGSVAFPPASSSSSSGSERRGSPPSGDYRPSSYKVNKKLEVMEKMGLQIKTPDGSMATAQQLRAAASEAPSSALPSYFSCPAATTKILDQVKKRKLLWSNKNKSEVEEAAKWSGAKFSHDQDGKQVNKFMRLMGIKQPEAVPPPPAAVDPNKKQEELFQAMQAQYEVARATTHTMRGVGLGFQRGQF